MQSALTERERQVAERIASGSTWEEAASDLSISVSTIRAHVDRIYFKIGGTGSKSRAIAKYFLSHHMRPV